MSSSRNKYEWSRRSSVQNYKGKLQQMTENSGVLTHSREEIIWSLNQLNRIASTKISNKIELHGGASVTTNGRKE
jgi:hypothetical protein